MEAAAAEEEEEEELKAREGDGERVAECHKDGITHNTRERKGWPLRKSYFKLCGIAFNASLSL